MPPRAARTWSMSGATPVTSPANSAGTRRHGQQVHQGVELLPRRPRAAVRPTKGRRGSSPAGSRLRRGVAARTACHAAGRVLVPSTIARKPREQVTRMSSVNARCSTSSAVLKRLTLLAAQCDGEREPDRQQPDLAATPARVPGGRSRAGDRQPGSEQRRPPRLLVTDTDYRVVAADDERLPPNDVALDVMGHPPERRRPRQWTPGLAGPVESCTDSASALWSARRHPRCSDCNTVVDPLERGS